jgi:hypothetical protein
VKNPLLGRGLLSGVGLLKLKSFYVEWIGYKNPCNASMCGVDALQGIF